MKHMNIDTRIGSDSLKINVVIPVKNYEQFMLGYMQKISIMYAKFVDFDTKTWSESLKNIGYPDKKVKDSQGLCKWSKCVF